MDQEYDKVDELERRREFQEKEYERQLERSCGYDE